MVGKATLEPKATTGEISAAKKRGRTKTTINQTGRVYGSRYKVERSIASGGMAEVFAAHDELLERTVALKLMHPEYARDTTFINRFRREAQAAASLNDPRVVSIFDWGSDDGSYYIVMEYVDGKTLKEIVQTEGPLTPERAVEIASEVSGALDIAHQKNVIHRDIKSANIAVTRSGQTKIMDFGIARAISGGQTVTQTGSVLGTANYLSPEQAQGMPVDARSDIYSLGVVLYEMLTRQVPFQGDTAVAIAYKHVQETPAPPSELNPEVEPALDSVVMKALAKNPDNRYQTAREMQMDLNRLLEGEQVQAAPILPTDQTTVSARRDATTILPPTVGPAANKRRKAIGLVLATIFVISVLGLIGALLYSLLTETGPQVVVPEVTGLPLEEAQRKLEANGLDARIDRRAFSDTVESGFVISQDPEDGTKAAENTSVNLVISRGPETVDVPDVTNKTRQEAAQILSEKGLELGEVKERADDEVEAGKVIEQSPDPGQRVDRGTSVGVVLSRGEDKSRVPDVKGLSEQEARSRIEDEGLKVDVRESCDEPVDEDRVIAQDPGPREEVAKGSTVSITVSRGGTVPGVAGDSQDRAISQLQEAGFRVSVQSRPSLGSEGTVIEQSPNDGETACRGSQVRIVVGRGLTSSLVP